MKTAIASSFVMALALILFACAGSLDGHGRAPSVSSTNPVANDPTAIPEQYESLDVLKIPKAGEARNIIINYLLAGIVAALSVIATTQIWQMAQFYKLNREVGEVVSVVGEVNKSLKRITSDTDSEKETRARVNRLILEKLGCKNADIERAVNDTAI